MSTLIKQDIRCPFTGNDCHPYCGLAVWIYEGDVPKTSSCAFAVMAVPIASKKGVNAVPVQAVDGEPKNDGGRYE